MGFNWDVNGDKLLKYVVDLVFLLENFHLAWNQVSGADDGFFQIMDKNFKWPQVWRSSLVWITV
jgi:hypothetical protein